MADSGPVLSDMEDSGDGMAKYAAMVLEFIKKDVFEDRKQVSVEEVVTLIAALTDISVSLLSRFRKDQVDPAKATEVGRDVFKYMVGRLGFDMDKLGKSNIYVYGRVRLAGFCLCRRETWVGPGGRGGFACSPL